jgi:hypothetical protein
MDLDELAAVEDPHQLTVGAHLDVLADQVPRDRVDRPGHLDVVVPVDFGRGVDRQVIHRHRGGPQAGLLLEGEQLGRPTLGRAVDARPGPGPAAPLGVALRFVDIDERLAGEHRAPDERHGALHARLIGRGPDPRGVDHEAPGVGVLDERLVEARLERAGPLDDSGHVVGDDNSE